MSYFSHFSPRRYFIQNAHRSGIEPVLIVVRLCLASRCIIKRNTILELNFAYYSGSCSDMHAISVRLCATVWHPQYTDAYYRVYTPHELLVNDISCMHNTFRPFVDFRVAHHHSIAVRQTENYLHLFQNLLGLSLAPLYTTEVRLPLEAIHKMPKTKSQSWP
jgi:hypothetical protein